MLELQQHVGSRRQVRIERNRPSEPLLSGYVLTMQGDLILMHPFDDFEPDGYTIIRRQDIVGLRSNEYERLWDNMLEGEGLLNGLDRPPVIDLSSIQAAITSAASRYRFLAIECEDEHERLQDFYFAELLEVTSDAVHLRCVDGLARWEDEVAVVPTDEITKVQFDTPYLNRFAKYIGRKW